jgi:hypothetical protein
MARHSLRGLRRRVYQILEQGPVGDRVNKTVDRFLVILIVTNLIAVALESIPQYAERLRHKFCGHRTFFADRPSRLNTAYGCGVQSSTDLISISPQGMRGLNMC